jgi:hypothetical protein
MSLHVAVRTEDDRRVLAASVRAAVRERDSQIALASFRTI